MRRIASNSCQCDAASHHVLCGERASIHERLSGESVVSLVSALRGSLCSAYDNGIWILLSATRQMAMGFTGISADSLTALLLFSVAILNGVSVFRARVDLPGRSVGLSGRLRVDRRERLTAVTPYSPSASTSRSSRWHPAVTPARPPSCHCPRDRSGGSEKEYPPRETRGNKV